MTLDLTTLTIKKAHEGLMSEEFTAVELAEAYLSEIKNKNKDINAYLEVYDDVVTQAKEADKKIKAGEKEILLGIPFALKDNILIEGKKVGAASKILEGYVAPYDATAISKLKEKGVVFIGRANMDEFAMGGSTENSAYGVTKNPIDTSRVAGGSSGGSVAAVAMNGALVALGSDTGGSVRQPASFCGVVGLKPTYGSVSRHGLMAMGSSLDVIGPIGKTVEDVEIIFDAIKGGDGYDATSDNNVRHCNDVDNVGHCSLKIGVPKGIFDQGGIDEEVKKNFNDTVSKLTSLGHTLVEVELPNISHALGVYYVIMPAEVSSNMARFDGMKYGNLKKGDSLLDDYLNTRGEGFGKEVRRRIMLGTYVLSSGYYDAYYSKANKVRNVIRNDFSKAFKEVDVIATPTAPTPAFKIGEKTTDPLSMYLADIFTVTANLVGIPAMSVPSGFSSEKLPLGIQIMAPHFKESSLFTLGKDVEKIK